MKEEVLKKELQEKLQTLRQMRYTIIRRIEGLELYLSGCKNSSK